MRDYSRMRAAEREYLASLPRRRDDLIRIGDRVDWDLTPRQHVTGTIAKSLHGGWAVVWDDARCTTLPADAVISREGVQLWPEH